MKTWFLFAVWAAAALAGADEWGQLPTWLKTQDQLFVPAGKVIRVEAMAYTYEATQYPRVQAGAWWFSEAARTEGGKWPGFEVGQGMAFVGPGYLQVVRGDPPRANVLVTYRLLDVPRPPAATGPVLMVERSPDLETWSPIAEVPIQAPAEAQAAFFRLRVGQSQ